ncbi:RE1-silencing transcription factor [Lithobates pipiens]
MATQMVSQAGSGSLFCNSSSFGIGDMYGLHDLSKAEIAAPRLIMLANVALTGDVNSGCSDYALEEDKQMAELTTVYENSFSDSEGERMDLEESAIESEAPIFEIMEIQPPQVQEENGCDNPIPTLDNPVVAEQEKDVEAPPAAEEKNKSTKSKPFQCRPCQYKAESEEEFVHHIKDHSAKRFIDHDTNKNTKESGSCSSEEVDTSKGPIRCDRCGYNTNRIDHYLAHLKHHNKAAENERVYKCTICTYTTVSEYHWKKHLRNHFPRIVYTCSQCSYFSDRKNNYIQHIRTHTGERPYQCIMCPYSSSQKTHLTRHMRTHSGEKPFKCEQCNYVASNQHEVTRHARQLHNGPKPLTCPHCNYKTADRSNFKKHVELHVNPRQFLCPVCDYAASKKCNLQYHIKSRHSGCTDITMDVSKVKLRTKKEVPVSEFSVNKQEEKENSQVRSEPVEKKTDGKIKPNKEKCETLKSASIGQVTKRSCKIASHKTEDTSGDKNTLKAKRAKRKFSSVLDKPLKTNDAQNTSMKKSKLSQNNQPVRDVKKGKRTVKSQKRKLFMNKSSQQKPLNKKKTMLESSDNANSKSKKTSVDFDSEANILQNQHSASTPDLPLGASFAAEIVVDQPNAKEPVENSQKEGENSTEEEAVVNGPEAVVNGPEAVVNGPEAVVNGPEAVVNGPEAVVNGPEAVVNGPEAVVNGPEAVVNGPEAVVNGPEAVVNGPEAVVNGPEAVVNGPEAVVNGPEAVVNGPEAVVNGPEAVVNGPEAVVNGPEAVVNGPEAVVNGPEAVVNGPEAVVNGPEAVVNGPEAVVNGPEAVVNYAVSLGNVLTSTDEKIETSSELPLDNSLCEREMAQIENSPVTHNTERKYTETESLLDLQTSDYGSQADQSAAVAEEFQCCPIKEIENNSQMEHSVQCKSDDSKLPQSPSNTSVDLHTECSEHNSCDLISSVSLDVEEDEGIHSHEGSDISDNVSERSDDSGLNGLQYAQETLGPKPSCELTPVAKTLAAESFVCIFCDRTFKKTEEYTKHLKRHLVNVYYLEKAAQDRL